MRYQVNCFLGGKDIVRLLRNDTLTLCRIHDCVTDDGMRSPSKQNPFVFCQILESNVFFLSSCVGLRECGIEMRLSKCRSRDPRAFRRSRHQCQIQVACYHAPDQLAGELANELNAEFRVHGQTDSENGCNPG